MITPALPLSAGSCQRAAEAYETKAVAIIGTESVKRAADGATVDDQTG